MALVDYFLKIDGIDGESTDSKHKGEIHLHSWSWGEQQSGRMQTSAVAGGGAGKVHMQDVHFTMPVNKSSPKLMLACASGEHIKKAVLTCRKAGKDQQEFLKVDFENILVSSFQTGGSEQGEIVPIDQISLSFAKVKFTYKEQKQDGTLGGAIEGGWDASANKKW